MSNSPSAVRRRYLLGGRDLEMAAIAELLDRHSPGACRDKGLAWGAKASDYRQEIEEHLQQGEQVVLIELEDDLGLTADPALRDRIILVDHHGALAGADRPTSLEQVFALLGLPASQWTRRHALIAANDRGHAREMAQMGATLEERLQIRAADRAAQGITQQQEAEGREACAQAALRLGGRLTVVESPHSRTATITDLLDRDLGGPGYENLLIACPTGTYFYGDGRAISALAKQWPESFYGGALPERGFWGCSRAIPIDTVVAVVEGSLL